MPALRRQRWLKLSESEAALHSAFQANQCYIVGPVFKKKKKNLQDIFKNYVYRANDQIL